MVDKKRGAIVGFFVGVWNLVNFTRRLVFNLIFGTSAQAVTPAQAGVQFLILAL